MLKECDVTGDVARYVTDTGCIVDVSRKHDKATVELVIGILVANQADGRADETDQTEQMVEVWLQKQRPPLHPVQIAKMIPCLLGNFGCDSLGNVLLDALRRRIGAMNTADFRKSASIFRNFDDLEFDNTEEDNYTKALANDDMLFGLLAGCKLHVMHMLLHVNNAWNRRVKAMLMQKEWRNRNYGKELQRSQELVVDDLRWAELLCLLRALREDDPQMQLHAVKLNECDDGDAQQLEDLFEPVLPNKPKKIKPAYLKLMLMTPRREQRRKQQLLRAALLCAIASDEMYWVDMSYEDDHDAEDEDPWEAAPSRRVVTDDTYVFAHAFADAVAMSKSLRGIIFNHIKLELDIKLGLDNLKIDPVNIGRLYWPPRGDQWRDELPAFCVVSKLLQQPNRMLALDYLDLSNTKMSYRGAKAIAEALGVNSALTSLDLRLNAIGAEGGAAIGDALRVNGALTQVLGFLCSACSSCSSLLSLCAAESLLQPVLRR